MHEVHRIAASNGVRATFFCSRNMANMAYGYWILENITSGVYSLSNMFANSIGTLGFDEKGNVGKIMNQKVLKIYEKSS